MFPSIVDFGTSASAGLEIVDDDNPSTRKLRDRTRLAMAVTGDVLGNIDVGQVFRIQADGRFGSPIPADPNTFAHLGGGTIAANITAHTLDNSDLAHIVVDVNGTPTDVFFNAIEFIRAGWHISGTISAPGDPSQLSELVHASITRVVCGRNQEENSTGPVFPDAKGIIGDILAPTGVIQGVFTTGPIGSPDAPTADPIKLWAGVGIGEIRALTETDRSKELASFVAGTPFIANGKARDFRIDVKTNLHYVVTGDPTRDGFLKMIQTGGGLTGSINASSIVPRGQNGLRSGILVRGVLNAPIVVDYVVQKCDIMGYDILAPIVVGISNQGAIVAHGRDDHDCTISTNPTHGYINSITVGYRESPAVFRGEEELYFRRARGFIGHTAASPGAIPCSLPTGIYGAAQVTPLCDYWPEYWLYSAEATSAPIDIGSLDTVIRARQIDTLHLRAMRVSRDKKFPPRVEAQVIVDSSIGDMREGAIWSGNYQWFRGEPTDRCLSFRKGGNWEVDFSGNDPIRDVQYDPTLAFASLGTANVGCVGQWAHVWFRDCVHFNVQRSCLGGLHVPSLDAGQTIWIGERLGKFTGFTIDNVHVFNKQLCECLTSEPPETTDPPTPVSCLDRCTLGPAPQCLPAPSPGNFPNFLTLPRFPLDMTPTGGLSTSPDISRATLSIGDYLGDPLNAPGAPVIHGQVIINGSNGARGTLSGGQTTELAWEGKVTTGPAPALFSVSGDFTPFPQTIMRTADPVGFPNPPASFIAPYYNALPAQIGGGSIGVAPFHLHETACVPPQNLGVPVSDRRFATITNSAFVTTGSNMLLRARSYGPIQATTAAGVPVPWQDTSDGSSGVVRVYAVDENNHASMVEVTRLFGIHGPGESGWTLDNRTIGLSAREKFVPKPGVYCLVPIGVRCADVTGLPLVEWSQPYYFRIAPDCDFNGTNDYADIFANPGQFDPDGDGMICTSTEGKNICRADFNRNGVIEVQDIFAFLNAWFAGCTQPQPAPSYCTQSADVNDSGSITIADVFDFLSYWFAANDAVCHIP